MTTKPLNANTKKPDAANWKVSWEVLQWVNDTCRTLTKRERRKVGQQELAEMAKQAYVAAHTTGTLGTVYDPADSGLPEAAGGNNDYPPEHQRWHDLLESGLRSGNGTLVRAITANLENWALSADVLGAMSESPRDTTADSAEAEAELQAAGRADKDAQQAIEDARALKRRNRTSKKKPHHPATGT